MIKQMDGVKNVCVVGVPDDILGEKVKAVIVTDKNYNKYSIYNSLTYNSFLFYIYHPLNRFKY